MFLHTCISAMYVAEVYYRIVVFFLLNYFVLRLGGFSDDVLPGVSLLSLALRSGLPVDTAILLGPGFSGIILIFILIIFYNYLKYSYYSQFKIEFYS